MFNRRQFSVVPLPAATSPAVALLFLSLVGACGPTEPTHSAALSIRAFAEVPADSVAFGFDLTNATDTVVELRWSDCPEALGAVLLVYDSAGSSSSPRWSFAAWRQSVACYGVPFVNRVEPHQQWRLTRHVSIRTILGDSLPPGSYQLFVVSAFMENVPREPHVVGTVVIEPN